MPHERIRAATKGKTWKVSETFQVSCDGLGAEETWKVLEDLPGWGMGFLPA